MHTAESYLGHKIEARAQLHRGKWRFNFRVHDFPKPGRGFGGSSMSLVFDSKLEAERAAVETAKQELDAFAATARITGSIQ